MNEQQQVSDTLNTSYVTLITNADYLLGAQALARSLRMCGAQAPLAALTIGDLDGLDTLAALGCQIIPAEPLPLSDSFRQRHTREAQHTNAPFIKGNKPQFHDPLHNFVKLRLWELTQYDRVIFLDADTVVLQNIDHLFHYPEFCAAPNVYESLHDFHRLNSGVFTAKPSQRTFEMMLDRLDQPDVFWRRTDQTFLETFFPQWHGLPYLYNTLQYVWFNLPALWSWQHIKVLHYQYEKPWQQPHPKHDLLKPLIALWWQIFEQGQLPKQLPAAQIHENF